MCEKALEAFPLVNRLIARVKMVFVKFPLRRAKYRDDCPDLPLPPEPVLTCCGTWLEAAIFYADNLPAIKGVVNGFNLEEAKSIEECQKIFIDETSQRDLSFIKAHLSFLPGAIKQLEEVGLPLKRSLSIIKGVQEKLGTIPGVKGQVFKDKMEEVVQKNAALKVLQEVNNILNGKKNAPIPDGFEPEDIAELKFCPIASADVERSFSAFRRVFSDQRQSFTEENLAKAVISNCFYAR